MFNPTPQRTGGRRPPVDLLKDFLDKHQTEDDLLDPLILIPTFNNGPYAQNMIHQLREFGFSRYLLLDGGSEHEETRAFLETMAHEGRLITLPENPGPRYFYSERAFLHKLPEHFCVTDPDLEFNSALPANFVSELIQLSDELQVGKVGFALDLTGDLISDPFFFGKRWSTIVDWEKQFWEKKAPNSLNLPAYWASIDTTFALYNKKWLKGSTFFIGVRVAGPFVARHLPWHRDNPFRDTIPPEYANGRASTWTLDHSHERFIAAFEYSQKRIQLMERSLSWRLTAPLRMIGRAGREATLFLRLRQAKTPRDSGSKRHKKMSAEHSPGLKIVPKSPGTP